MKLAIIDLNAPFTEENFNEILDARIDEFLFLSNWAFDGFQILATLNALFPKIGKLELAAVFEIFEERQHVSRVDAYLMDHARNEPSNRPTTFETKGCAYLTVLNCKDGLRDFYECIPFIQTFDEVFVMGRNRDLTVWRTEAKKA
jgi:hypothetical protein